MNRNTIRAAAAVAGIVALIHCCTAALADEAVKALASEVKTRVNLFASGNLEAFVEEQHIFFKKKHPNVHTWSLREGVLACDGSLGNCGFLRYTKKLDDFHLELEYRTAAGCNSGVCIRSPVPYTTTNPNTLPSNVGFEVQILDDAGKPVDAHCSGAFYGVRAPKVNAAKPAGQWNKQEITCQGTHLRVVLNGQVVQDIDQSKDKRLANRPLQGYLSFQNHGGNAEFRAVWLTVLDK